MTKDEQLVLSVIRKKLIDKIGFQKFELWFDRTVQWNLSGTRLSLSAPNAFSMERLRRVYQRRICEVLASLDTPQIQVEFAVSESGTDTPKTPATISQPTPIDLSSAPLAEIKIAGHTRPDFATLISGASNQVAVSAANAILDHPGAVSPLLIYGPSGSGKTHLLQAIWGEFRSKLKPGRAVYLTAEQFTTHFLEGLRGKGLASFRRRYRDVDVLLIDEIEFFVGKSATMLEFHYTIDSLIRCGKQLVFSAKAPATEIPGLGTDLVARLSGGLVCNIDSPDESMRGAIARQYCKNHKLQIRDEVIRLLVRRVQPDARHVQGALNRVRVLQQMLGASLTLQQAEQQLDDLFQFAQRPVGIREIEKAVCDIFGLEQKSLQSSGKTRSVSQPRMLAMWLARKYTRAAYSEIGEYFGKRAHNTVISANQRVTDWIQNDACIAMPYGECRVTEAIKRVESQF